jgi:hypothetical protein
VVDRLPGMKADSEGNVWLVGSYSLFRWDGESWSMLGDEWLFWDWGGVTALEVGPDDTLWIGTHSGLARWDGIALTLFDTTNAPLPASAIRGIDVREDGTIGISASDFGSQTPFPSGVALVRGDPAVPTSWTVYRYGESPLPHYQLGAVAFDPQGSLWISAESEGVALLRGCSPGAWVNLVRSSYGCRERAEIGLTDCDLDVDPGAIDTALVRVASSTEPEGELVRLTEIAPAAGVFLGTVALDVSGGAGILRVRDGDVLDVTYVDAGDGAGGHDVVRGDTAAATCSLAMFPGVLRARDKVTFGWDAAADVHWVRGTLAALPHFGIEALVGATAATSLPAPEVPASGSGFYWLVRPDGTAGSWSSGGAGECAPDGACPPGARDGNLPAP